MLRRFRPLIVLGVIGWIISRLPPETRQRLSKLLNDQLRNL
jgi:hypothetical protein